MTNVKETSPLLPIKDNKKISQSKNVARTALHRGKQGFNVAKKMSQCVFRAYRILTSPAGIIIDGLDHGIDDLSNNHDVKKKLKPKIKPIRTSINNVVAGTLLTGIGVPFGLMGMLYGAAESMFKSSDKEIDTSIKKIIKHTKDYKNDIQLFDSKFRGKGEYDYNFISDNKKNIEYQSNYNHPLFSPTNNIVTKELNEIKRKVANEIKVRFKDDEN